MRAVKVRIYPNKVQKELIEKHFGCARWVYNYGLERKTKYYNENKKSLSTLKVQAELPKLKNQEETKWLKEVNSQSLQATLKQLDTAFVSFFKKRNKFPVFKSKKNSKQSFQVPQYFDVDAANRKITVPKIGEIRFRDKFDFSICKEFRQITISRRNGKYYAAILFIENDKEVKVKNIKEATAIGIDLGIKTYATFSDGNKIENPKFEAKYREKLAFAQQKLEKKQKDSKNYLKQKKVIGNIYDKIRNSREDFLHKLTTNLVKNQNWDTFCLEDLSIKTMQKDNFTPYNRAIGDAGWNIFRNMLQYKTKRGGKSVIVINPFEASSKTCSCGVKNENLTLDDRIWTCSNCQKTHDRDILAANNVKTFALIKNLSAGHADPKGELGGFNR